MKKKVKLSKSEVIAERDEIIRQLKKYSKQLEPFFDLDLRLNEFSSNLLNFKPADEHLERQKVVKEKIDKKFSQLFGEDYKNNLKVNLDAKLAFNIADHHQVLNHPLLISSNVISGADKLMKKEKQDATIVISSGDVPPNNFFSKNGFQLHGKRVPIFSNKETEFTSYFLPSRDFDFVANLKKADRWKEFNTQEKKFLEKELKEFQSYDFSHCDNYTDQISVIVKESWPRLFERSLRGNLPELLYITQEELTTECLIDILQDDNIISRCILKKEFRDKVIENFSGIVVAWRQTQGKGTHFFWRKYPGQPRSLRMFIKDNKLVPHDERFKDLAIPFKKEIIINLLKKREIYPNLFLIFSVIHFYAGVRPLSGYGSLTYLDLIKKKWLETLNESGLKDEAQLMKTVRTDSFVAGLPIFFKRIEGQLKTLYAPDIFYDGGVRREYLEKVINIPFKDLLVIASVDIYAYYSQKYIPESVKIKPKITMDDLVELYFDWL